MKTVRIAYVIFVLVFALVFTNSIFLTNTIKAYENAIKEIDTSDGKDAEAAVTELYKKFKKNETFISLTVTHEDLTNIEEMFSAMIGAAKGEDTAEIEITKSRLCDALSHLKRLVGINIDSIL